MKHIFVVVALGGLAALAQGEFSFLGTWLLFVLCYALIIWLVRSLKGLQ